MLTILSPAKSLNLDDAPAEVDFSQPQFLQDANALAQNLRQKDTTELRKLMRISDSLADLNYERYQNWRAEVSPETAKQALLAFDGDVYKGFTLDRYDADDFAFAQRHLRILSGLYGVLRPLDLMQPYRLEMGTRLENARGKNLYEFWGDRITQTLNQSLAKVGSDTLINLASKEYSKAIRWKKLNAQVITPVFKEERGGKLQHITFFAKRARGTMANYALLNRLTEAESLKNFREDGYRFRPEYSSDKEWLFSRNQEA